MPLEYRNYRDFPLRLSPHMRSEAAFLAEREGITLDAFIVAAVSEKVAREMERGGDVHSTGADTALEPLGARRDLLSDAGAVLESGD